MVSWSSNLKEDADIRVSAPPWLSVEVIPRHQFIPIEFQRKWLETRGVDEHLWGALAGYLAKGETIKVKLLGLEEIICEA